MNQLSILMEEYKDQSAPAPVGEEETDIEKGWIIMDEKEFCKIITEIRGEEIDNIKQIVHIRFTGDELFGFMNDFLSVKYASLNKPIEEELQKMTEDRNCLWESYNDLLSERNNLKDKLEENEENNKPISSDEWISVEDSLPEYQKVVLVALPQGEFWLRTLGYVSDGDIWYSGISAIVEKFKGTATHWQPLPSPPNK